MATPEELKAAQGAERKRIADIKALAPVGMETYVETLAFADEGYTVEQASVMILKEQKANPPKPLVVAAVTQIAAATTSTNPGMDGLNQFMGEAPAPLRTSGKDPLPTNPKMEEAAFWEGLYAKVATTHNQNNTRGSVASVRE